MLRTMTFIACAVVVSTATAQEHSDPAREAFRAASPEEQARMIDFEVERRANRAVFLAHGSTIAYIDSLCALQPGPTHDSEWQIAATDYKIFERKSVADPIKAELLGDALIDCSSPTRVVSGRLDTTAIRRLRPRPPKTLETRITIEHSGTIEVQAPSLTAERSSPTECKPLPARRDHSMCDGINWVAGCPPVRTTCDQPSNAEGPSERDMENLTRSMGMPSK